MSATKKKNARRPRGNRSHNRKRLDFNNNVIGDYRNDEYLRSFVTSDRGKILPRRITGMPAKRHRQLVKAIKRARNVLLMK